MTNWGGEFALIIKFLVAVGGAYYLVLLDTLFKHCSLVKVCGPTCQQMLCAVQIVIIETPGIHRSLRLYSETADILDMQSCAPAEFLAAMKTLPIYFYF